MYSKCWEVIKDDAKKTFEVCGQESNNNYFTNSVHGMQKAGMNVSYVIPPVSYKNSSRDLVKVSGYTKEVGLHQRLLKEYMEKTRGSADDDWDTE